MIAPMAPALHRQTMRESLGEIDRLPVNFLARPVDDHNVTIDVASRLLGSNPASCA